MNNLIYLDVCAVPIFIFILATVYTRKTFRGLANRRFIAIVCISLAVTIIDIASALILNKASLSPTDVLWASILCYAYFILRNISVVLYVFFLFHVTRTTYLIRKLNTRLLILLPHFLAIALILLNPMTKDIFMITAENGYVRGELVNTIYTVAMLYGLGGITYLFIVKKQIDNLKFVALISNYVLSMLAALIQRFHPELLLEMCASALAFIFIVLLVLRPEEITDTITGQPSYMAFQNELKKIIYTRQKVQIVVINLLNSVELRTYLNEVKYVAYVQRLIKRVYDMWGRRQPECEVYFEHPGSIYVILNDWKCDAAAFMRAVYKDIEHESREIIKTGVIPVTKMALIRVPDNIFDYDDIVNFAHDFSKLVPYDIVFTDARDMVHTKKYKISSNMEDILEEAIAKNRFELYYHPIYSVSENRFKTAEALIRLNDSRYGSIPPSLFIPAAETRGMMVQIGYCVLEKVFDFISRYDFDELGLEYIDVNLSIAQFLETDLTDKIKEYQDRFLINSSKLNWEITETTYDNIGVTIDKNINSLYKMGYSFSLDDYGTGYSNMQRVAKLPLKIIKMDKSLVDDIDSEQGMSIVKNTVKMMKDIGMELVAEGVETHKVKQQLSEMGCDYIQGYFFSKPLPEEQFIEFLKKYNFNLDLEKVWKA